MSGAGDIMEERVRGVLAGDDMSKVIAPIVFGKRLSLAATFVAL